MKMLVNGVQLYFDVDGAGLRVHGAPMREMPTVNLLHELSRIACPTLAMGGALDPMLPIECLRDLAAAIPKHLLHYHEFENCGHGVIPDVPVDAMAVLQDFIGG